MVTLKRRQYEPLEDNIFFKHQDFQTGYHRGAKELVFQLLLNETQALNIA